MAVFSSFLELSEFRERDILTRERHTYQITLLLISLSLIATKVKLLVHVGSVSIIQLEYVNFVPCEFVI